jgi:hypothetical protein
MKHGRIGKRRNQKPKKRGSNKEISDLEQKMLSARSGQFRGGMPANNKGAGGESQRNGLVYAK